MGESGLRRKGMGRTFAGAHSSKSSMRLHRCEPSPATPPGGASTNISRSLNSQQPPKQPFDQNEEDHLVGGLCNSLILMVFMAPEVGLEPTTLRLTAVGVGVLPVTTCCYKLLSVSYLRRFLQGPFTTRTACFATGFERVTTQNPPHFLVASLRRHCLVAHQHSANCSI